jgi:hypothetical protein
MPLTKWCGPPVFNGMLPVFGTHGDGLESVPRISQVPPLTEHDDEISSIPTSRNYRFPGDPAIGQIHP